MSFSRLADLPTNARVALFTVVGGIGTFGVAVASGFRGQALWVLLCGIVIVTLLLAIMALWFARQDRKKAAEGDLALEEHLRKPSRVSDPEIRAKLAAMTAKLLEGIAKLRSCGVSATDPRLPWYLIVGESGSGKSEAIRRSGLDFPPGLNEEQQGAGGTINMDWWFTERGILLDTAGRLVVPEKEFNSLGELGEFMAFLKKVRPHNPINGMILVIPADSLAKDSVGDVERKSGQIAQRLDTIRRALGIRFPVYVVVTKSDLLPGFRGFFADLNGPIHQRQIMGWSNKAPMDQLFDPVQVDQYLGEVRQRLLRRRMRLMLDPVATRGGETGRRIEEVDDFYEFPDTLVKVGPNLRLYLQRVFGAGAYSPEPPFLRGIYFTSSLEEGAELDEAIARLRGITVAQLQQEGARFRRERAVFITDLFDHKICRERGLVIRATKAQRTIRLRRAVMWGSAAASILLFMFATWYGQYKVRQFVERDAVSLNRVSADLKQNKVIPFPAGDLKAVVTQTIYNVDPVRNDFKTPTLFAPVAPGVARLTNETRTAAFAHEYAKSLLRPVVESIRDRVGTTEFKEQDWSDNSPLTRGLAQLCSIKTAQAQSHDLHPSDVRMVALLKASVSSEQFASILPSQIDKLNEFDELLRVPASLYGEDQGSIQLGINALTIYWDQRINHPPSMVHFEELTSALSDFNHAEAILREWSDGERDDEAWNSAFVSAKAAQIRVTKALQNLGTNPGSAPANIHALIGAYKEARNTECAAALRAYAILTPVSTKLPEMSNLIEAGKAWAAGTAWHSDRTQLGEPQMEGLFDGNLVPGRTRQTALDERFAMYAESNHALQATGADALVGHVSSTSKWLSLDPSTESVTTATTRPSIVNYDDAARINHTAQAWAILRFLHEKGMGGATGVESLVAAQGNLSLHGAVLPHFPRAPFNSAGFDPAYDATAARAMLSGLRLLDNRLNAVANARGLFGGRFHSHLVPFPGAQLDAYVHRYMDYWCIEVRELCKPDIASSWAAQSALFDEKKLVSVTEQTAKMLEYQRGALAVISEPSLSGESAQALSSALEVIDRDLKLLQKPAEAARITASCKTLIEKWNALDSDPVIAREEILRTATKTFRDDYFESAGPVFYWKALAARSIERLSSEASSNRPTPFQQFKSEFGWIHPLFRPVGGMRCEQLYPLGPLALKQARVEINEAILKTPIDPTQNTQAVTMGQGGRIDDVDADRAMDRLRYGRKVDEAKQLRSLSEILQALPSTDLAMTCEIRIPSQSQQDILTNQYPVAVNGVSPRPMHLPYPFIVRDSASSGQESYATCNSEEVKIGTLGYGPSVHNDLVLSFKQSTHGTKQHSIFLTGFWAPFELLHHYRAFPANSGTGCKEWFVELSAISDGHPNTLWLKLTFEKPVPSPTDWPTIDLAESDGSTALPLFASPWSWTNPGSVELAREMNDLRFIGKKPASAAKAP